MLFYISYLFSIASSALPKEHGDGIVNASIDVYQTITTQLLPTPAKSHYTFNLRDLSKIFQGMCTSKISLSHNTK